MTWSPDPGLAVPLGLSALLFARGAKTRRHISKLRQACFWAGWTLTVLALVSPLHAWSQSLFFAHMIQHELLMVGAALLLVLSRPLVPVLWGLPMEWRRELGGYSKVVTAWKFWRLATARPVAFLLHAAAIWIWHAPRLFEAALVNGGIHAAQHLSFFGSALLFWQSLFPDSVRRNDGVGVLYVFATAIHTSLLGVFLTFASGPWYPSYTVTTAAWGLTPLEDQQLGGLIMWIPGGVIYLLVCLLLARLWIRQSDLLVTRSACAA